jgi:hypothetical protein
MARVGKGFLGGAAMWMVLLAGLVACSRPLPEAGSPSAELYRKRCGTTCHRPVAPAVMKFPAWRMVLPRMEQRMRAAGNPLTADERDTIVGYLQRHSSG